MKRGMSRPCKDTASILYEKLSKRKDTGVGQGSGGGSWPWLRGYWELPMSCVTLTVGWSYYCIQACMMVVLLKSWTLSTHNNFTTFVLYNLCQEYSASHTRLITLSRWTSTLNQHTKPSHIRKTRKLQTATTSILVQLLRQTPASKCNLGLYDKYWPV
jgi:hypothetical protein